MFLSDRSLDTYFMFLRIGACANILFFHFADIIRTMKTSEDKSVFDKVVNAIFDDETISKDHSSHSRGFHLVGVGTSALQCSDLQTEHRDHVVEVTRDVFRRHCARRLEILPMHLFSESPTLNRFLYIFFLCLFLVFTFEC